MLLVGVNQFGIGIQRLTGFGDPTSRLNELFGR